MRKIYRDFVKGHLRSGKPGWVVTLGMHYLLTKASFLFGRPLHGPILGTLITNYTCNLRCRMCGIPGTGVSLELDGQRELNTGEIARVIDDFARIGTRGIGLTGGEPLLRPDLAYLVRRVRERGMLCHLNTNGTLLDEERVRGLLASGLMSLGISLDGASPSTHDRIRGIPGAFCRAVEAVRSAIAIRRSLDAPLRIKIVSVLSEENIDEVPDYLFLATRLGVDCVEFIPRQPFLEGPGMAVPLDSAFLTKADAVARSLHRRGGASIAVENSPRMLSLLSGAFRGEPSPLRCHAGYNSLVVDCYGRIFPCVPFANWNRPAGDVRESGLYEFWHSRKYDRVRLETKACRACTLNCQAELNLLFNPFTRIRASGAAG